MWRIACLLLTLTSAAVSGAPLDFKFDPDARRPSVKPDTPTDPWLLKNGQREGVETLPSGVQIEMLETGYGRLPTIDDTVIIHYSGWLTDGQLFVTE